MSFTPDDLGAVARRMYSELEPLQYAEAQNQYALAIFCQALGLTIDEINEYVRDSEDGPGWSMLLDLERAPEKALPWLAQFVGVRIAAGLTDQEQRDWIAGTASWRRGTLQAMTAAVQATLTGLKQVITRERFGGAYQLSVVTYTAETPDEAATLKAILSQKPAGLVLTYSAMDGQDFQNLLDTNPLFSNVLANYTTFQDVVDDT